jgi:maleylpyruvate isomerase
VSFADLDLAERLLIARRGTDYFARRLDELSDADLEHDSMLPDWTRRHVVAHLGYNADALCRLLDWAATGIETPMYASVEARAAEIADGATASPAALRNQFERGVARLNEKWRDLPDAAWDAMVRNSQGQAIPAAATVWMRVREVWIHAVDLNAGARFADFPEAVLDGLLDDIVGKWSADSAGPLELEIAGRPSIALGRGAAVPTVRGRLPGVVQWAVGRGPAGLDADPGFEPPRWM